MKTNHNSSIFKEHDRKQNYNQTGKKSKTKDKEQRNRVFMEWINKKEHNYGNFETMQQ